MEYSNSDLDHLNLMDMVECDAQNGFEKILLPVDKMGALDNILSGESALCSGNIQIDTCMDSNSNDMTNINWMQPSEWADALKLQQYQLGPLDIENNDLLVNPQTVLPIQGHHMPEYTAKGKFTVGMIQLDEDKAQKEKSDNKQNSFPQSQFQFIAVTSNYTNPTAQDFVTPVTVSPYLQRIVTTSSPSHASPTLVEQLQNGLSSHHLKNVSQVSQSNNSVKVYPKPVYSYSCLIAMALKNSNNGSLPVSEIYTFMM